MRKIRHHCIGKTLSLLLPSGRTLYAVHALNLSRADKNRFTSAGAFQRAMLEAPFTHAEYLKLLRSLADGKVWDSYDPVHDRYAR